MQGLRKAAPSKRLFSVQNTICQENELVGSNHFQSTIFENRLEEGVCVQ